MNEKLITVTGRGTICVVPDMTRLVLTLKSIHSTYEEAYVQTKNDMDKLASIMEKLQLDKTLPKTIHLAFPKKSGTNTTNTTITKATFFSDMSLTIV